MSSVTTYATLSVCIKGSSPGFHHEGIIYTDNEHLARIFEPRGIDIPRDMPFRATWREGGGHTNDQPSTLQLPGN